MRRIDFVLALCALCTSCAGTPSLHTPDGRDRTFHVHTPASSSSTGPLPIVIALHGGGGNGEQFEKSLGLDELADEDGFLAVYPDGTGKRVLGTLFGTWNSDEQCCGFARDEGVDDVGFLSALIDELGAHHGGDVEHVFVTGLSNGGDMTHRMGCELADRVDAIAPVSAPNVISTCAPSQPVPTMIVHGTADPCALYDGGAQCGGCFARAMAEMTGTSDADVDDTFSCTAVPDIAAGWRARNGCTDAPSEITLQQGAATCETWREGCANDEVTLCTIEGGGHSFPGSSRGCTPGRAACDAVANATGPTSMDIDGSAEVWRFFQSHL